MASKKTEFEITCGIVCNAKCLAVAYTRDNNSRERLGGGGGGAVKLTRAARAGEMSEKGDNWQ